MQLKFEETRNTSFLIGSSADYLCSTVRFSIKKGNALPVFTPTNQTGRSNLNKRIYNVTMQDSATHDSVTTYFTGSADVVCEPEDLAAPIPASPVTGQDVSRSYH